MIPDPDNAGVGSNVSEAAGSIRISRFAFSEKERRGKQPAPRTGRERAEGERPVSGPKDSDGKPCSGVRGDQKVSTALPFATQVFCAKKWEKTLSERFLRQFCFRRSV